VERTGNGKEVTARGEKHERERADERDGERENKGGEFVEVIWRVIIGGSGEEGRGMDGDGGGWNG